MNNQVEIKLNGKNQTVSGQTLQEILLEIEVADKPGIAVALQDQVIPRSKWPSTPIQSNDELIIITATQGG